MKVDIIIPAHNENENLLKLFEKFSSIKIINNLKFYICYDDKNDLCISSIDIFKKKLNSNSIYLVKNNSVGALNAIKTGLKKSNSEYVIVYPADDFSNILLIERIYQKCKKNYDIIIASRFIKGGKLIGCPIVKKLLLLSVAYSLRYIFRFPFSDPTNGFRCFSRKIINSIPIETKEGFAFSFELLIKAYLKGYSIVELPSVWIERQIGMSNFKIIRWAPQYLKWYFRALFHFIK